MSTQSYNQLDMDLLKDGVGDDSSGKSKHGARSTQMGNDLKGKMMLFRDRLRIPSVLIENQTEES